MGPSAAALAAWMAWVASVTGLPLGSPMPPVTIAAHDPFGGKLHSWSQPGIQAVTMSDGSVWLHPGWRQGDARDDCLLAHELVHVGQYRSGRAYQCTAERERLAYAVQEICLAMRGVDFWRSTGYRPRELARVMECGG